MSPLGELVSSLARRIHVALCVHPVLAVSVADGPFGVALVQYREQRLPPTRVKDAVASKI